MLRHGNRGRIWTAVTRLKNGEPPFAFPAKDAFDDAGTVLVRARKTRPGALGLVLRLAVQALTRTIEAAGVPTILCCSTRTDHLGGNVTTIRQKAPSHQSTVAVYVQYSAAQTFAGDHVSQVGCGGRASPMVPLRCVETPHPNPPGLAAESKGVPIEDFTYLRHQHRCLLRTGIRCHQQEQHGY